MARLSRLGRGWAKCAVLPPLVLGLILDGLAPTAARAADAGALGFGAELVFDPQHVASGIADFLDRQGRLVLPGDFSGSLDPAGFDMVLDADGAPRFLPQDEAADPDERWDDQFFLGRGCDNLVLDAAPGPDGELYLGGSFASCGSVRADRIIKYDPDTVSWSALGNGLNGAVGALAMSGTDLYVGGLFTEANAGGATVSVNNVARYDTVAGTWHVLGSSEGNGVNGAVSALMVSGTDLYVGGNFAQANVGHSAVVLANNVARFDTVEGTWHGLGSNGGNGVNQPVFALAELDGNLYVGGLFTEANVGDAAVAVNYIARFNSAEGTWHPMGSSGGNGVRGIGSQSTVVHALAVIGSDLFVGGEFLWANAGGAELGVSNVARFDTAASTWHAMGLFGTGVLDTVRALAVSGTDLFVGGRFITANVGTDVLVNRVARYDITSRTWHALGSDGGRGVNDEVLTLAVSGSDVYVGGRLTEANVYVGPGVPNPVAVSNVASFDTGAGSWSALGIEWGNGLHGSVQALAVSGSDLYLGGLFTDANVGGMKLTVNHIVRFDMAEGTWHVLGTDGGKGVSGFVSTLAVVGNDLYVGGGFTRANEGGPMVVANRIARFDKAAGTWHPLGNEGGSGVNNTVRALAVSGSDLFLGGAFSQANVGGATVVVNRIVRFNTVSNTWHALGSGGGNGVNNTLWALAASGSNLYVGGDFTAVNVGSGGVAVAASRVARFDTGTNMWQALGSGEGNGVSGSVRALAVSGTELYVGGDFTQANVGGTAVTVNNMARFDTIAGTWQALGSGAGNGVNDGVRALAASGSDLYVGGWFTQANIGGETVAAEHVARFDVGNGAWTAIGSGTDSRVFALLLADSDNLYVGGDFRLAGNKPSRHIGRYTTRGALDLTVTGSGSGSVNSSPSGIDCAESCTARFSWDQPITLTATADPGSEFVGWSGAGCSGSADCVIDFDQEVSVSAEFKSVIFSIGGAVSGLAPGTSLVLQNNQADDLTISANGSFSFGTQLPDGSAYLVEVLTQPSDPNQTCVVDNDTGTVSGASVDNVAVSCTTDSYLISTVASNGSITSDVDPLIEHGQTTTVTAEADTGHYFSAVSGCGGVAQSNQDQSVLDLSYTTGPITAACTVSAEFLIRTYVISLAAVVGEGSVEILTDLVNHGDDASLSIEPAGGWLLESVSGSDNCTPQDQGDGQWQIPNVQANCAITVNFRRPWVTVSLNAVNNPAVIGFPATYEVTVTGELGAPTDGRVVVSANTLETCMATSASSSSGATAVYVCQITFLGTGPRQMTALFDSSPSHGDGQSAPLAQGVEPSEMIFRDRFQGP